MSFYISWDELLKNVQKNRYVIQKKKWIFFNSFCLIDGIPMPRIYLTVFQKRFRTLTCVK